MSSRRRCAAGRRRRGATQRRKPRSERPRQAHTGFRSENAEVDGVHLHYWIGGDPDGDPVVLMHGFLATGYAWRDVAVELAQAGRAVLVPDMRGYGDSDKPPGVEGYDGRALGAEIRALAARVGFGAGRRLTLAAHDMGAPPALLWAADHPEEIAALVYIEEPVMLGEALQSLITYTPEATRKGSLWWWLLSLAPGAPEALLVGAERAFLTWFYDTYAVRRERLTEEALDEYLRTYSGREGVLGALGVYRAVFKTIEQTEPLTRSRIRTPVVALGGAASIGAFVGEMVGRVAEHVEGHVFADCGHFLPEEDPRAVAAHILSAPARG